MAGDLVHHLLGEPSQRRPRAGPAARAAGAPTRGRALDRGTPAALLQDVGQLVGEEGPIGLLGPSAEPDVTSIGEGTGAQPARGVVGAGPGVQSQVPEVDPEAGLHVGPRGRAQGTASGTVQGIRSERKRTAGRRLGLHER